jgi:hypothetical protein
MKQAFNSLDWLKLTGLDEHMTILDAMCPKHVKTGKILGRKWKGRGGTCWKLTLFLRGCLTCIAVSELSCEKIK